MTVELFLALLGLIIAEFWLRRRQAELANRLIEQYCQRQHWQLLSVARHEEELMPVLLRTLLKKSACFVFEFSVEPQSAHRGELLLQGLHAPLFRLPPLATPLPQEQTVPAADNVIPFRPRLPDDRR